jgi:uncharacterized protein YcbK (DUF882 family)
MISRRNFIKALIAGITLIPFDNVFASKGDTGNKSYRKIKGKKRSASQSVHLPLFKKEAEGDFARGQGGFSDEKILNMYNIHTGETLKIQYCSSGTYAPDSLEKINYFLRCHYTNEVREMDIGLLDLLCDIQNVAGTDKELQIVSGYRSQLYNEFLVFQGRNVSRNSLHLQGLAIDFAIEGMNIDKLSRIAKSFTAGGVGKYPAFVHIDVGRVRYW